MQKMQAMRIWPAYVCCRASLAQSVMLERYLTRLIVVCQCSGMPWITLRGGCYVVAGRKIRNREMTEKSL